MIISFSLSISLFCLCRDFCLDSRNAIVCSMKQINNWVIIRMEKSKNGRKKMKKEKIKEKNCFISHQPAFISYIISHSNGLSVIYESAIGFDNDDICMFHFVCVCVRKASDSFIVLFVGWLLILICGPPVPQTAQFNWFNKIIILNN